MQTYGLDRAAWRAASAFSGIISTPPDTQEAPNASDMLLQLEAIVARTSTLTRYLRAAQARNTQELYNLPKQFREMMGIYLTSIQNLSGNISSDIFDEPEIKSQIVTATDLYEDIKRLQQEFESVEIDLRSRSISVTTAPIILSDVDFGPFKIHVPYKSSNMHLNDIVIEALVPNLPRDHDNVTHPHVRDNRLCFGEGQYPARHAMENGFLLDLFTIIHNTLQTYSEGDAYLSITTWEAIGSCVECSEPLSEGGVYSCLQCDRICCESCIRTCSKCDEHVCFECSNLCVNCDQIICESCICRCRICEEDFCSDCLSLCNCDLAVCDECSKCCSQCNRVLCTKCMPGDICDDCSAQNEEKDDNDNS